MHVAYRHRVLALSWFPLRLSLLQVGEYVSEKENVDEDILLLGQGPTAVEVDIMQPLDANKSPKVRSPILQSRFF